MSSRRCISLHKLEKVEKAPCTSDGGGNEGGDEGEQHGEMACRKGGAASTSCGTMAISGGPWTERAGRAHTNWLSKMEEVQQTSDGGDGGGDEGGDEGDQRVESTCDMGGATSTSCGGWAISGGPSKAGAHRAEAIPIV